LDINVKFVYIEIDIDDNLNKKKLLLNLAEQQILELDNLVKMKLYKNRAEAIRAAIRTFLERKKLGEIEEKLQE
jgi:Arc/MetJ-type ribon-helix-helix transcriptional regulator